MRQIHAKSACCSGKIYHYGYRRRQCSVCRRTWRIRSKKVGRKGRRQNSILVQRYFRNGGFNLLAHANALNIDIHSLWQRLRQSRDYFLRTEHLPKIPATGDLIMIIDALRQNINGEWFCVYFRLIRSVKTDTAIILEPIVLPGRENRVGWSQAIDILPSSVKGRIRAIISDGLSCFISLSKQHGWLLQRCHFHLLKELHCWFSRKRRSRYRGLFDEIEQLVRAIISTTDEKELNRCLRSIKDISQNCLVPERFKARFLRGFIRHFELYRTYLRHPEFNLPTTSNSCEAICGQVRSLLNKAHGFNSVASFKKWIKALCLFRKNISCK